MVFTPLPSVRMVPPTPFCPQSLDPDYFLKANILATLILSRKEGVPLESALICCSFLFDTPGQVIHMLTAVFKMPGLSDPLNLIPFLPSQALHFFSEGRLKEFSQLKVSQFGKFYEAVVAGKISYGWQVPFKFYTPKKKYQPLVDNGDTQNLTGQKCPDFIREFEQPIAGVLREGFDQKASVLPLKKLNHIRPVVNSLEDVVEKTQQQLVEAICDFGLSEDPIGIVIQERLFALTDAYILNQDAEFYAASYNKLRDEFTDFFISHRLPINRVIQVGIEHFVIDITHVNYIKSTFAQLYDSSYSPVLAFYYNYLAENRGEIADFSYFLVSLAKHLTKPTEY